MFRNHVAARAAAVFFLAACGGDTVSPGTNNPPPPPPLRLVATVTVAPALDTVEAYDPKILTAVLRDAKDSVLENRVVRWKSSNPWVASIDSVTGELLGRERGTVTITATSETKRGSVSRVIVVKYRSMATGSMHACDIASGGFVWCWGLNGPEGRIGGATMG